MCHKELFHGAISNPFCCLRRNFCLRQFLSKTKKIPKSKNKKMENLPKTKKPRLLADCTLDHTGGWGGRIKHLVLGS